MRRSNILGMVKIITVIVLITIPYFTNGQNNNSNNNDENDNITNVSHSLKLRMMIGIFRNQFEINPNYCINRKSEMMFGINYRFSEVDYLVRFKVVPAKAFLYGINFGYIFNSKRDKKIALRFETDLHLSLIYTEILYLEKKYYSTPVLATTIYFVPNLKISIFNNIDLCLLYKFGINFGTNSSFPFTYEVRPVGFGRLYYLFPFIDLQYHF